MFTTQQEQGDRGSAGECLPMQRRHETLQELGGRAMAAPASSPTGSSAPQVPECLLMSNNGICFPDGPRQVSPALPHPTSSY